MTITTHSQYILVTLLTSNLLFDNLNTGKFTYDIKCWWYIVAGYISTEFKITEDIPSMIYLKSYRQDLVDGVSLSWATTYSQKEESL